MPKNKDTRDFTFNRSSFDLLKSNNFAAEVSNRLPGNHQIEIGQINEFTGSPRDVKSINAPQSFDSGGGTVSDALLIDVALNHVESISPALGFTAGQKAEFIPDSFVKKTSSGSRAVSLQQQYHGIPVIFMERTAVFDSNGVIAGVSGNNIELPPDLETNPAVTLDSAAKAAAFYMTTSSDERDPWTGELLPEIEIDLSDYQPEVLGMIPLPSRPSVLAKGPFGENIPAYLVLFYQGATTRLGWHFIISTPNMEEQFAIIIEADAQTENIEQPEVLYAKRTSKNMAVKGSVWLHNPKLNPSRTMVDFPLTLDNYPIDSSSLSLPTGFPNDWVDSGGTLAVGNTTIAVTGNTANSVNGTNQNGTLIFDPGNVLAQGDIQKVINIFYFCNYMHDFFYMLGFDEEHGNFQKISFVGLGTGNDPVLARAHPGPVFGTANMSTSADGIRPVMNMGLVSSTNRHTAFDSDVVFHEFTHGVSNRLVGRRFDSHSLDEPQSGGMGEGWSDYFALTIQNCRALINNPAATEKVVTGDWVTNRSGGIRLAPFNDNYPATYGNIGTPPYDEDEHSIGEIWCAALMKMNRDFGAALDDKVRGHQIGWQIVVDGLKLSPSNPSFLDARDAIIRALDDLRAANRLTTSEHGLLKSMAWRSFARFGMGANAFSNGPSLTGIIEDLNPPTGDS